MKSIASNPIGLSTRAVKVWLLGTTCGIALTISLVAGTGHLQMSRGGAALPVADAQQSGPTINGPSAPGPVDEPPQDRPHRSIVQPATPEQEQMIPPPIDGARSYNLWPSETSESSGVPPQPIFGQTKY